MPCLSAIISRIRQDIQSAVFRKEGGLCVLVSRIKDDVHFLVSRIGGVRGVASRLTDSIDATRGVASRLTDSIDATISRFGGLSAIIHMQVTNVQADVYRLGGANGTISRIGDTNGSVTRLGGLEALITSTTKSPNAICSIVCSIGTTDDGYEVFMVKEGVFLLFDGYEFSVLKEHGKILSK